MSKGGVCFLVELRIKYDARFTNSQFIRHFCVLWAYIHEEFEQAAQRGRFPTSDWRSAILQRKGLLGANAYMTVQLLGVSGEEVHASLCFHIELTPLWIVICSMWQLLLCAHLAGRGEGDLASQANIEFVPQIKIRLQAYVVAAMADCERLCKGRWLRLCLDSQTLLRLLPCLCMSPSLTPQQVRPHHQLPFQYLHHRLHHEYNGNIVIIIITYNNGFARTGHNTH